MLERVYQDGNVGVIRPHAAHPLVQDALTFGAVRHGFTLQGMSLAEEVLWRMLAEQPRRQSGNNRSLNRSRDWGVHHTVKTTVSREQARETLRELVAAGKGMSMFTPT